MSSSSNNSDDSGRDLSKKCFLKWMDLQQEDLAELLKALDINDEKPDNELNQLKGKVIQHFQDYADERKELAKNNASCYFAPTWMSCLENSLLWIAGCRPSMLIRLLYALCGYEVAKNLSEFIEHGVREDSLGGLSSEQLHLVSNLHLKTVKEEDLLSGQLASLQEEVADEPIATNARNQSDEECPMSEELKKALDDHDKKKLNVIEQADELRLNTLKELMRILTPHQGVDYLAASKKVRLYLHKWGKIRDHSHGGNDIGN